MTGVRSWLLKFHFLVIYISSHTNILVLCWLNINFFLFCLFIFTAVTVRYLTKRYIGEYSSTSGELNYCFLNTYFYLSSPCNVINLVNTIQKCVLKEKTSKSNFVALMHTWHTNRWTINTFLYNVTMCCFAIFYNMRFFFTNIIIKKTTIQYLESLKFWTKRSREQNFSI